MTDTLDSTGRYVESSLHGPEGWCGETRPHEHGLSEGIITYTDGHAADWRPWVAGWNMPGYLPETDPETFDTLGDAVAYLRETAERWADEDGDETAEIHAGPDGADGWYEPSAGGATIHLWAERSREDA